MFKLFKTKKSRLRFAPYNISIYENLLQTIHNANGIQFAPFYELAKPETNLIRVFVRHDIDTIDCVNNFYNFLKINEKFGIKPGVFFLVNGEAYPTEMCRNIVAELREKNYVIGLHSVCYLEDDYMSSFQRELEIFQKTFEFPADTFNTHGLGSYRHEFRINFYHEISNRYQEFGFQYSDCYPILKNYDHIAEDCHKDEISGSRFLKDDFFDPSKFFKRNSNLILTHPCYWYFVK